VGERRPGRDHERDQDRVSLAEAAEILGVSKDGVRMRVRRGTLRSVKGEDGRVYVFRGDLDADQDKPEPEARVEGSTAELIEVLREQVEDLRSRLDRETEANRENRRIIAGLIERVPELESPQEPPEAPETAEESPERAEPRPATPGPQEGAQRRPWWRRVFGG
jgi:hypothetical protein